MNFSSREEGQGLAEYGWTIVLVAILIMAVLIALGGAVTGLWGKAWQELKGIFLPETVKPTIQYLALLLGYVV